MRRCILQIGFGNFGPTHLAAWRALGLADDLYVVDQDEEYIGPVASLCSFLGTDPGGMNPGGADKKQQRKEWLHTRRSKVIA